MKLLETAVFLSCLLRLFVAKNFFAFPRLQPCPFVHCRRRQPPAGPREIVALIARIVRVVGLENSKKPKLGESSSLSDFDG